MRRFFTPRLFSRLATFWMAALLAAAVPCADAQVSPAPTPMQRPGMRIPRPVPSATPVPAPAAGTASPMAVPDASPNSLNYQEASSDLVLLDYANRTKRTLLPAPNVPKATITLRSHPNANLSDQEYLSAIEQILNLNGIALEPVGEKFLRVVPSAELRKLATPTLFPPVEGTVEDDRYVEDGRFVSRMVELKYIDIDEAKTVIDGFVRTGAQMQTFERTNSILVTDSADNVNRILEVIGYIDRPIIAREEPNIIQIRYAKAADIKTRLLEIVAEAQAQTSGKSSAPAERQSGSPGTFTRPLPADVTLPRAGVRPGSPAARAGNTTLDSVVQDAERGVIRGKVQIIADDRTNILIIITRPENMVFFDRVIKVLDIETAPDVLVEVFRLEHAVAADVATLLNDLIGNEGKSEDSAPTTAAAEGASASGDRSSQSLAEFVQRRREAASASVTSETKTKVGKLDKENIKILADERTNALVIMASNSDMAAIRELITSVDIMLSQVVIETVLIELNFEDTLETGVDWVQRAMRTVDSSGKPVVTFAGQGGGGFLAPADPLGMTTVSSVPAAGAGISYYLTALDLNLDLVLRAAASDSRARIMSSPVIMTQDNKEAVLEATVKRYFFKGKKYAGEASGNPIYEDDVEQQDVGLTLKVTPRINNKGYVVLTVEQTIDAIAGTQVVNDDEWPIVSSRRMGSDIAVNSGDTVVLGGLAQNTVSDTKSKVPILGDIPFLGWFFRTTRKTKSRNEVVVFLTPRVVTGPADAEDEARNRKAYLDTAGVWRSDWSGSRLSDPISEKDRKALIERAKKTLLPPRHSLTRELAPLNEFYDLKEEPAVPAVPDVPAATNALPDVPAVPTAPEAAPDAPSSAEVPAVPAQPADAPVEAPAEALPETPAAPSEDAAPADAPAADPAEPPAADAPAAEAPVGARLVR